MESDNKDTAKKAEEPSAPNQDVNIEAESRFLYQKKGPYELPANLMPKFSRQNANVQNKKEKVCEKPSLEKMNLKGKVSLEKVNNLKLKSSQEKVAPKLKPSNEKLELKVKKSSHEKLNEKPGEEPTQQATPVEESEKVSAENPNPDQSAERLKELQQQIKIDEGRKEAPITPQPPLPEDTATEAKSLDPKSKLLERKTEKREDKKKDRLSKSLEDNEKGKKKLKVKNKSPPKKKSNEKKEATPAPPPEPVVKPMSPPPHPVKTAPAPPPAQPRPIEKAEKSKATTSMLPAPAKKPSKRNQAQKDKNKKTFGFLKAVYAKTKFWARKSDCVVEPTKEMLAKAYVVAEYNPANPDEYKPPLKGVLTDHELKARMKNPGSGHNDVFLHNRPFWLTRLTTDTFPPKCKLQMHRQLKQAYQGNTSVVLPKLPKRDTFHDPVHDPLDKIMSIDKQYGQELVDVQKRVVSNTFYSTLMFETDKLDAEKNKRGRLMEREQKSSSSESTPRKLTFHASAGAPIGKVYTYDRKQRPKLIGKKQRPFKARKYTHTERKGAVKKTVSNSNSISQDVKK